jgi:hypothetical protein
VRALLSPARRRRSGRLPFALALLLASVADSRATGPIGDEFQANTYTTLRQWQAQLAVDGVGNFVVVWRSEGQGNDVFGQRFGADGQPLGAEFQVNSVPTGVYPAVAAGPAGGFLVTWARSSSIFAQRFDASGVPAGAEFQVNSGSAAFRGPAVAAAASGFVVVWSEGGHIIARRYDGAGVPQGSEFQVDGATFGYGADVAADAAGNFVVAWQYNQSGPTGANIFARRFDASGVALGSEFLVNSYTYANQEDPAVAVDAAGNFIIAWHGKEQEDYFTAVARRFDAAGTPLGPDFFADESGASNANEYDADVAVDAAGNFVISWLRMDERFVVGDTSAVMVRSFDASGNALGPQLRANGRARLHRHGPRIAGDGNGNAVVSWMTSEQDGSDHGVFGQRLFGHAPISGQRLALHDGATRAVAYSARDIGVRTFANPAAHGAYLHVYNSSGSGEAACIPLPSAGWEARGMASNPSYRYADPDGVYGPCVTARMVRGSVLRVRCRATPTQPIAYSLDEPQQTSVAVQFIVGPASHCSDFGGTIVTDSATAQTFSARNATAPVACPVPPSSCP